jgi:CDP-diacylglycerol pyrophosphatase
MKCKRPGKVFVALTLAAGLAAVSAPSLAREIFGEDLALSRKDLWRVIQHVCIPAAKIGIAFPCTRVVIEDGRAAGYAILPVGAGHVLTVPTQHIVGIESRELLSPGQPNYWQAAWEARERLEADFSRKLDRDDVALALNSAYGRSQDQLHIHTSCVKAEVKAALARESIGPRWTRLRAPIQGKLFSARWVAGADLRETDVFGLLAPELRRSSAAMARQAIVVVGGWDRMHAPGFFVLDDQAGGGDSGHAESLLDFKCRR